MHDSMEWQDQFAVALRNPELPAPGFVIDSVGGPCPQRFSIYRNNIVLGLVEALRDAFPVARRIVGNEFFDAVARLYAMDNPPRSPVLLEYGIGFAEFVERFSPASTVPYLGDVCRIEKAWLEAYHAAEAAPIGMDSLSVLPPSERQRVGLEFHPSVRLLRSSFPALTIWSTNVEGNTPIPVDLEADGEDVLIARPRAEVEVRSLSRAEMDFIQLLTQGASIAVAAARGWHSHPVFSLPNALEGLISAGVVVGINKAPHFASSPKSSTN